MNDRIWDHVEPTLKGYGDMIDMLWTTLTPEQQATFLAEYETDTEDDTEDEEDDQ